jgi:hypothetical protein
MYYLHMVKYCIPRFVKSYHWDCKERADHGKKYQKRIGCWVFKAEKEAINPIPFIDILTGVCLILWLFSQLFDRR